MAVDKRWYVLYVESGKEKDVQKKLSEQGYEAVVPIENRMIRSGGKWISRAYVVFPGYVFINIEYDWWKYYTIAKISGVLTILGGGKEPIPLTNEEVRLVIYESELFREPPVVRLLDGGGFEIVSGSLLMFKRHIKRIDRHARRLVLSVPIAGKETEFTLSVIKAGAEPALPIRTQ